MKKILLAATVAAMTMVACNGGRKTTVTAGDPAQMDTLSYALGANIATGMNYQLSNIPFDYKAIDENFEKTVLGKAPMKHEEARKTLQDYFNYETYGKRMQAVDRKRKEADSIRVAGGDTTTVEYGADPEMFETEEERDEVSAAFGVDMGYNVRESGLPLQAVWILEGMRNVRDKNAKMTEEEVGQYLQYYFMVKRPAENAEA
ncbi:MAG: FKBP-type peptidyl-prolyl cis-trans isomerase N-terminal domain-containing protein, partial [Alistipes sp.]|nr:FKBP-type peptidyl-prolyl cis-trans isomerase N-terminal domain-containing protein [Alistipes sp.]